jgi:hypothetical protein
MNSDMKEYIEPNWDDIVKNIEWTEFEYSGNRFRCGLYTLDNNLIMGIHVYLGDRSPDPSGWAGMAWCNTNNIKLEWPSNDMIEQILKENNDTREPDEPPTPEQPVRPARNIKISGNVPVPPASAKRF